MAAGRGERARYSAQRLSELARAIGDLAPLLDEAALCVYATGSYGRLEAWAGSDIDLFFLYGPPPGEEPPNFLTFIRVAARLVEATEQMAFPPFSGDGKYLETLDVNEMERVLGSPQDDSTNTFTARMLLLLESHPISDRGSYDRLIERIVGFYYHDFEDHADHFVPTFLLNDILRFWRTLTLNYEHDRYDVRQLAPEKQERARAKSSLKNYKLKLSRLATCFSMVLHLASECPPVRLGRVVELTTMTPQERFVALAGRDHHADDLLGELSAQYERFLANVQRDEDEVVAEFGDRWRRREHLAEAAEYGATIHRLLEILVPDERMRHLVI
jgi:predicted nucleotidyltransferase